MILSFLHSGPVCGAGSRTDLLTCNADSAITSVSFISVAGTGTNVTKRKMPLGKEINSNLPEDEEPGEVKVKEIGNHLMENREGSAKNGLPLEKSVVN
uniref:Uncharacterized protein n=1 Tax=Echinococcus granulosus TaxID=6210 RepID=A0A068X536_ECHGR|nr:hypothetical protein EgrG_002054900 [Echinococcus granulosus]